MPPDTQPDVVAPPRELALLAERVRAIGPTGEPDHERVIAALIALEEALVLFAEPDADARARMRHAIEQLEDSVPDSLLHANYVRVAFEMAAVVMARGEPSDTLDAPRYHAAVEAFVEAVEEIDPDEPLLEQHASVLAAFASATRVLFVAVGLAAPFEEPGVDPEIVPHSG